MAQDKMKAHKGLAQRHIHSRISYLYQAATYLANITHQSRARTPYIESGVTKQSESSEELQCAVAVPKAVSDNAFPALPTHHENGMPKIGPDGERGSEDSALSRQLIFHLQAISLKSQVRLSPTMKHTICKRCGILLVPGSTSTSHLENSSRGGRKPWADILVTTCTACGTAKRFPVGAKRQGRRESRIGKARNMGKEGHQAVRTEDSG